MSRIHVLFVCLGNICRSPSAEGLFRKKVASLPSGIADQLIIDSAGTGDWHIGKPPDERAQTAALRRGYDLGSLRARQASRDDFDRFDYIVAMDQQNLADLEALKPVDYAGHLGLFLDFHPQRPYPDVPDPYYGGEEGFDQVLDLLEAAADGLLEHLEQRHFSGARH